MHHSWHVTLVPGPKTFEENTKIQLNEYFQVSLQDINQACDQLQIFCSTCSAEQVNKIHQNVFVFAIFWFCRPTQHIFTHLVFAFGTFLYFMGGAYFLCSQVQSSPFWHKYFCDECIICIIPVKIIVLDLYKVSIFRYIIYSVPWPLFPKVSIFQLQVLKDATVLPVTAHQVQLQWQMLIFEKMDFEQDLLKRKSVK